MRHLGVVLYWPPWSTQFRMDGITLRHPLLLQHCAWLKTTSHSIHVALAEVWFVKAQRKRWLGHAERMSEAQMPKRMLRGRHFPAGRDDHVQVVWTMWWWRSRGWGGRGQSRLEESCEGSQWPQQAVVLIIVVIIITIIPCFLVKTNPAFLTSSSQQDP